MQVTDEITQMGVTERAFTVERPEEPVPGILWTPEEATGTRPLVAFGHGATQDKRAPHILAMARRLVRHHGYAALAIDLPFHGSRRPADPQDLPPDERLRRLRKFLAGRDSHQIVQQGLGDWTAALDAVRAMDGVGEGPLGYWGLSMGTYFGVPLVASEPRIEAAVLGLFGWGRDRGLDSYDDVARRVSVPVLFLVQWNDELIPRELALELFDLLGSSDKRLHANPGPHVAVPLAEGRAAEEHFVHHLGDSGATAAAA